MSSFLKNGSYRELKAIKKEKLINIVYVNLLLQMKVLWSPCRNKELIQIIDSFSIFTFTTSFM